MLGNVHLFIIIILLMSLPTLLPLLDAVEILTVHGHLKCRGLPAYAVLLAFYEMVEYYDMNESHKSGFLRVSRWNLTDHFGNYSLHGFRYDVKHELRMNITHHCIPSRERRKFKNCFMNVMTKIPRQTKNITEFSRDLIDVEFQSRNVKCVYWDYELPEEVYEEMATRKKSPGKSHK